jgi:hypothetical protein
VSALGAAPFLGRGGRRQRRGREIRVRAPRRARGGVVRVSQAERAGEAGMGLFGLGLEFRPWGMGRSDRWVGSLFLH